MQDYEYLFSKQLHEKLKEKIKGKVWVKVYNNDLHVKITTSECESKYEYVEEDLSTQILDGFGTDYFMCRILKGYRTFINDIFFK